MEINPGTTAGFADNGCSMRRVLAAGLLTALAGCAAPRQLWFGGDVHLGNGGAERLRGVAAALAPARGVVNLEGPIGTQAEAEASGVSEGAAVVKLVNGPGAAAVLAEVGIAAAGIENNHADDLGEPGRQRTRAALERAGVRTIGPAQLELNGLKVVLTAHDLTGGVPAGLGAELRAARVDGAVLVATFHVTGPPLLLPSEGLKQAVELALAAGATVVVAHGTHALSTVERRGGAVIAWGLGNLAFSCACTDESDALTLRVEFDAAGKVLGAEAVPISAGLNGEPARLSVQPKLVLDLLEALGAQPSRRLEDRSEFQERR